MSVTTAIGHFATPRHIRDANARCRPIKFRLFVSVRSRNPVSSAGSVFSQAKLTLTGGG
jgi:hypothetical protein